MLTKPGAGSSATPQNAAYKNCSILFCCVPLCAAAYEINECRKKYKRIVPPAACQGVALILLKEVHRLSGKRATQYCVCVCLYEKYIRIFRGIASLCLLWQCTFIKSTSYF